LLGRRGIFAQSEHAVTMSTPPCITPQAFVDKWRSATPKERSAYQEHFIDVCRLIGHPTTADAVSGYDRTNRQSGYFRRFDVPEKNSRNISRHHYLWEIKQQNLP
jgi:hypothetical protein